MSTAGNPSSRQLGNQAGESCALPGGGASSRGGEHADQATEKLKEMGNNVKAATQQQFDRARETAAQYYEQGRERVMQAEESLEECIRAQPIKSVLIAAGVGFALGKLF